MNLKTSIGNFTFENPLMNASGVLCKTEKELNLLLNSSSGSFVTKSCTIAKREGNPKPRYCEVENGSINSMGLPNLGADFYINFLNNINNKNFFFSISGLSVDENIGIIKKVNSFENIRLIELNLSCPNVVGKPQIAYEFEDMDNMLKKVCSNISKNKHLGVKLPPYFDLEHFNCAAKILNRHPKVKFVTCINSIGNGLLIDIETEKVLIKPKEGLGGIGGKYVLPTALANVNTFYKLLENKQIIGCGGVYSAKEVFMHLLCGASMVQIGTYLNINGVEVFDTIIDELKQIMTKKGYKNINDFKGKLKFI